METQHVERMLAAAYERWQKRSDWADLKAKTLEEEPRTSLLTAVLKKQKSQKREHKQVISEDIKIKHVCLVDANSHLIFHYAMRVIYCSKRDLHNPFGNQGISIASALHQIYMIST